MDVVFLLNGQHPSHGQFSTLTTWSALMKEKNTMTKNKSSRILYEEDVTKDTITVLVVVKEIYLSKRLFW